MGIVCFTFFPNQGPSNFIEPHLVIVHVSFLGTPLEAGKSYLAVENRMVVVGGRGERKRERNGRDE